MLRNHYNLETKFSSAVSGVLNKRENNTVMVLLNRLLYYHSNSNKQHSETNELLDL